MDRERSQGIQTLIGFVGLVVVCGVFGYGAWKILTRPKSGGSSQRARQTYTGPDSVGFVSVAGEGVDLELTAPSGSKTQTASSPAGAEKINGSETSVDCPGFVTPGSTEAACTASINVNTPPIGDYTVTVRSSTLRAVVLNIGWGSASQAKRGAFDIRVQVARGGATAFGIIVTREGVTQRSEPRAVAP
ncbi:MAG: hypothetical protein NTX19_06230 [Gemmatimonadetes bacterium]|nr:hypothetical protein [Gemmatimonadota bacterium]